MNAAKQAIWLFIALLLLAGSGWYFAGSQNTIKLDADTLTRMPDAIISNLTVQQYGEEGKLTNFLSSPQLRHYPKDNSHWLKTPHIIVTQENQSSWDIRSLQARTINGGEQISFNQNVVIQQGGDKNSPATTIKTNSLTYFSKQQLAISHEEVSFEQPGNIMRSKGMKAYLAEKRVQLLSQARGTYEPKHA